MKKHLVWFAAAMLLAGFGCRTPPTVLPASAGKVEVAGCEAWSSKGCVFARDGATLRIWVDPRLALSEVWLDDSKVAGSKLAGGEFFEIAVGPDARRLALRTTGGGRLELGLEPSQRPSWYREAAKLYTSGEREAARQLLSAQPFSSPYRAHIEARFARWEDDVPKALDFSLRAAELWLASGLPKQAIGELALAAQIQAEEGLYAESRLILGRAEEAVAALEAEPFVPTEPLFLVVHMQATLAKVTGDIRNVLAASETLHPLLEHGMLSDEERSDLVHLEAIALAEVGRFEVATLKLDGLEGLKLDEPRTAELALQRGWVALLERQAGRPGRDPRPFFDQAWAYQERVGTDRQKLNTKLNLARLALLDGRPTEARAHLRDAAAWRERGGVNEKFEFDEIEARLLLLDGQGTAALERYRRLASAAEEHQLAAAQWQALVGVAESLAALGRNGPAIDTFEQARQLEDRELLLIPVDKGRETFLARREQVTRRHLELLLEEGRRHEAFDLLRRYRTQALVLLQRDDELAALDAEGRRKWDLFLADYRKRLTEIESSLAQSTEASTADGSRSAEYRADVRQRAVELASLLDAALSSLGFGKTLEKAATHPGELQLGFFPRRNSWLMFAMDDEGELEVQEVTVTPGTPLSAVAPELLNRVSQQIHAASKLRLLPWGDLDLHAVTFEGKPLLATRKIAYGVDVPATPVPIRQGPKKVLLVGLQTPPGMLRTGVEIQKARVLFENKKGFEPPEFLYGLRAKAPTVREALKDADFFHFAGHGFFDQVGSQSRLSLAGGELRAGDVLTLPKVPEQVLLSTCSAGQATRASGVEGLGLAYAFIIKGSRQVLAATREVDDRQTAELTSALYEHIAASGGEIDLVEALQKAQLRWLAERPNDDAWKAFRVFEP